jgi:cytochrome o ubiquinol oxidase subunit 3
LFATYVIMVNNTAGGPGGKDLFDLRNAGIETALLLVSSTTFGFASLCSRTGNRGAVIAWLPWSPSCWARALCLSPRFAGMIRIGAAPTAAAFSAFFTLVGTHGLHASASPGS